MSALAKAWLALCAILVLAPITVALSSEPTPTQAPIGAVSADAGFPILPDMTMQPIASLAR
jgi:hypothetical protein